MTMTREWPYREDDAEHRRLAGFLQEADAEEAKRSGGMIALFPRQDYAEMLAIAGGEPEADLHCTLVFLGDDVTGLPDGGLSDSLNQIVGSYSSINARVFGHAIFNPDSDDPAGVYLLNSPQLDQLQQEVLQSAEVSFQVPEQHKPFIPHITCSYGSPPTVGQYSGEVVFDRIVLAMAGSQQEFPLLGVGMNASRHALPHVPLR